MVQLPAMPSMPARPAMPAMPARPTMPAMPAFIKNRLKSTSTASTTSSFSSTTSSPSQTRTSATASSSNTTTAAVYSHEVPDSATATRGAVHVVDTQPDYEPSMTLYTNLLDRKQLDPDGTQPLFGTRTVDPTTGVAGAFEWVTFGDFLADVDALAAGLSHSAIGVKRNDIVGVFSKNRYEWSVVEHACNRMTYTLVPLYDTLGPTSVPFIMNHTEMRVVFCAKTQFETLMSCIDACPHIKTIVQFEAVEDVERELATSKNVTLLTLDDVYASGQAHPVAADPPLPSDLSTICYTSGTTGDPKGAMLTHANLAFTKASVSKYTQLRQSDVHLSFLPLAHVFERCVQTNVIATGGRIGFYQGDVTKLLEDIAALQPTLFPSVPRVLNRIVAQITQRVAATGGAKKFLFDQAFAAKRTSHNAQTYSSSSNATSALTHALWDPLVFAKIRTVLGGRVRLMMNGSAPLSQDVKQFIEIVFSCPVLEGYGLTESSAVVAVSNPLVPSGNHVGIPLPGVEVCLEDVADMHYTSRDSPLPRGEVLVRGRNVFNGYYKQPELTNEVMSADGWFHTGDIGCWNADGTLRIIDRKKNIFKLSQGEYVAPEKIEDVYLKSPFVAQIFVYGDSLQNYLVGVVVPDRDVVAKWAADNNTTGDDGVVNMEALLASDALKTAIVASMEPLAIAAKLFGFERVQKLVISPVAFGVENDLLTPTFKPKRNNIARYFGDEFAAVYASAPAF